MMKEEMNMWLKESKYIRTIKVYDEDEEVCLYENGGKLYLVEFMYGEPIREWGNTNYEDYVEPVEVIEKKRVVEETYYVYEDGEEFY